jgi:hypothetical protein
MHSLLLTKARIRRDPQPRRSTLVGLYLTAMAVWASRVQSGDITHGWRARPITRSPKSSRIYVRAVRSLLHGLMTEAA